MKIRTLFYMTFGFILLAHSVHAQKGTGFFIESYYKNDLEPISQTDDGKYLHLQFADDTLTALFSTMKVLSYESAFDELDCEYLNGVFAFEVEDSIPLSRFSKNPLIRHVELIPHYELNNSVYQRNQKPKAVKVKHSKHIQTTPPTQDGLPNDYYIPTFDTPNSHETPGNYIRNDYLDLIQAPCAWKLTHGNPHIVVGIAGTYFSEVHEELAGKFDTILGSGRAYAHNYKHGIGIASLIAGNTNNGKGMASIGYNTRLVGAYSRSFDLYERVKDLVLWSAAHNNKIRVINMSWSHHGDPGLYSADTYMAQFYRCIRDKYNIVLVESSGNKRQAATWHNKLNNYNFPASLPSVISVTAVGSRYSRKGIIADNTTVADSMLRDVLWWNGAICCPLHPDVGILGHLNHEILNDSVDIAAPGYDTYRATNTRQGYYGTDSNDTYAKYGYGTSEAAPIVAGTAALMLAVNPSLTPVQVREILVETADRIDTIALNAEYFGSRPDSLSIQLGRVNAYKAVKMAKYYGQYPDFDSMPKIIDLMVRDSPEDRGNEPNTDSPNFWQSEDIWVRNQDDGIEESQNPEYNPVSQSYVYVRIKNKGCDPSSGNGRLRLHWTKGGPSNTWPASWNGGHFPNNGPLRGDTIGTVDIPVLKPGEETVVKIPWSLPDPNDYAPINPFTDSWHFCLMARILSDDDPITPLPPGSTSTSDYIRNNNDVAAKNITVVDLVPTLTVQPIGGVVAIENPFGQAKTYNLRFFAENDEVGKKIFNESEVSISLGNKLLQAWEQGGAHSTNLKRKGNTFIVTGNHAALTGLQLAPHELGMADMRFNFLTKEITAKEVYRYYLVQEIASNGKVLGGETYKIVKHPRPLFYAQTSGPSLIDKGDPVNLDAVLINEPAAYNWYDEQGNLIYQGADFSTSVQIGKKYKLEVIALSDGYKDYTQVQVNYKPNRITALYPNPTTGQVSVAYKINSAASAYLALTPLSGGPSDNYILDVQEHQLDLDLSNLPTGIYVLTLVTDGAIADSKNLEKE